MKKLCKCCGTLICKKSSNTTSMVEDSSSDFVDEILLNSLFPEQNSRRAFLSLVGKTTAMAAIATVLPLNNLKQAVAADKLTPEKKSLNVAFLPILCAAPLIMAEPLGYYREQGLDVKLHKRAGWALVRDQVLNKELDASHFLAPMPLAMTLGLDSKAQDINVAAIQNLNGQALVMGLKHKNNQNPKNWKGLTFALPFEHSMHNYLLRYFLAEHGLDPDRDVSFRLTSPPDMVANLKAGNIDGFFGPEPFNQRAVWDKAGYIHTLSKDIWNGHPCCSFGASKAFINQNPQAFLALFRAIIKANVVANDKKMKRQLATILSPTNYLNQPELVLRQSLTGRFADGIDKVQDVPERMRFDALPQYGMAVWMLTQMKRWGYLKADVDYKNIAEQVFMLTDAKAQMQKMGYLVKKGTGYEAFQVMGKTFDPTKPKEYVDAFLIKR